MYFGSSEIIVIDEIINGLKFYNIYQVVRRVAKSLVPNKNEDVNLNSRKCTC